MALNPNYANSAILGANSVNIGDTSRTSPSSKATVLVSGSNGARVERISFSATGATTNSFARIFLYNGTSYFLRNEIPIPAKTPVAGANTVWQSTLEAWSTPNTMPILLPYGWSIVASINDTQSSAINIIAEGGNF